MKTKNDYSTIKKLLLSLIPLQAFSLGLPYINSLITGILVGQFAKVEGLAVIGFVGPLTMLINAVNITFSSGSSLCTSKALGKGNRDALTQIFNSVMLLCLSVGILLAAILFVFSRPIAILLGAKDSLIDSTSLYIRGYSFSVLFMPAVSCLFTFLQISGLKLFSTITLLCMIVINALGITLNFTTFHGGMFGIGFINTLVYGFAFLLLFGVILIKRTDFNPSFKHFSFAVLKDVLQMGLPAGANPFFMFVKDRIINSVFYATGGPVALSAVAVAKSINSAIGSLIQEGYSASTRITSGYLVAQRDTKTLRDLTAVASSVGFWIYLVGYAIIFFFARPFALLFGASPENVELYTITIRLLPLWLLTNCVRMVPIAIYQALKRTRLVLFISFVSCSFCVISALVFSKFWGFYGAALSAVSGDCLSILLLYVVFAVFAKRLPHSFFDLAFVPNTLSASKENRLDFTIHAKTEACEASAELVRFCKDKGLDNKKAYYGGLCLEEILVFALEQNEASTTPSIDVRILYENTQIRMLIRDNSRAFNMDAWLNVCSPCNPEKSLGIRMVKKLSTEMTHSVSLGINTVSIEL